MENIKIKFGFSPLWAEVPVNIIGYYHTIIGVSSIEEAEIICRAFKKKGVRETKVLLRKKKKKTF